MIEGGIERGSRLFVEEEARGLVDDGFRRAAGAIGDDRCAARLCLHRRETEIFLAGKKKAAGALIMIEHDVVGLSAKELNVHRICREGPKFLLIRSGANDDESALAWRGMP